MTQEQTAIQEQNELIAVFCGYKAHEDGAIRWLLNDSRLGFPLDDLRYHESWQWLMPVVEKISKINNSCYGFTVDPHSIEVRDYSKAIEKAIVNIVNDDKYPLIEMYYMAVVDFIRWHNSYISSTVNNQV